MLILGVLMKFLTISILLILSLSCSSMPQEAERSGSSSGGGETAPGTRRMAERLQTIVRSANPRRHITSFGDSRVAYYRNQIAQTIELESQIMNQMTLGHELMVNGRTEEALAELNKVQEIFDRPEVNPSMSFVQRLHEWRGVAYLRLGEQENCIDRHTTDSCIMPIRGDGVHTRQRGSSAAVAELTRALENDPENLRFRWLLSLAQMTLGQYPDAVPEKWRIPPEVFESDHEIGRFTDVASGAGLDTVTLAGGVVLDDLDGDGNLDVMTTDWGIDQQMRLFRNNGDGSFTDRTAAAGLTGEIGGLNMTHADYDNDGDVDVLVLRGAWMAGDGLHPNSLLRNNGDGTFEDVTEDAGLLTLHPTQTASWADYNGDGAVDLFVGNESTPRSRNPCQLFHNNGDGTFSERAAEVGVDNLGFVKGVAWGDYDNDGRPDLYLSRFGQSNVLYRNAGPGGGGWSFVDVTAEAGVEDPRRSFPTWFWDFDNDGWEDLLVAPFAGFNFDGQSLEIVAADYLGLPVESSRTSLFRNNGDGTFTDVAKEMNLDAAMLAMGANFGDLDNDGFLDCYFGTGDPYLGTLVPNRMFRNDAGRNFQDVTTSGGFGHVQKGHGVAFADLDNDGDQDVYAVMGGSHQGDVYQNALFENPGSANRWITLRLEGVDSNRSAIGARIRVQVETADGVRDIHVTVGSGGSFGASSLQQEIGLGAAASIREIEISWPGSGSRQVLNDVGFDQVLKIRENEASPTAVTAESFKFPAASAHHH